LRRALLPLGASFPGPAIVEQLDATVLVGPGEDVTVDEVGNLIITVPPAFKS
jgi:N-methylhydantoinase A